MVADFATLLTEPAAFFEDRGDDVDARGPLVTVAAVAAVGVLGSLAALGVQLVRLPGSMAPTLALGAVFAVVVRAAFPVVVWLVYSAFFLAITALLDGEGEPRDTILLAGYGMAPRVLGVLVVSAGAVAANLLTPVPAGAETVTAYSQQVSAHPANLAAPLFKLVTFLWSGYIWVYAVRRARDVGRRTAAVAVGVPLALELLVTLGLVGLSLLGSTAV